MQSLLSEDKCCYICKTTKGLHKHHIYYGSANRKKSQKWGCFVTLCEAHHNLANEGVHFNPLLDARLKKECQVKFEEKYGHQKFMETFHKNYI